MAQSPVSRLPEGPLPQLRTVSQSLGSCQELQGDRPIFWNQLLFCPSSQPFSGDTHTRVLAHTRRCLHAGKAIKGTSTVTQRQSVNCAKLTNFALYKQTRELNPLPPPAKSVTETASPAAARQRQGLAVECGALLGQSGGRERALGDPEGEGS